MIIYSHTVTPRLQYVVNFLSAYYRTPIRLMSDEEKYLAHPDAHRINYSYHRLREDEIWIHSHALLFESAVRPVKIECFEHSGYKAFFKAEGDAGFDLFAALFYLITRYEEYLPHQKDVYGRYAHQNSLAFREGFLHLPLINIWLEAFRTVLQERFSNLRLPPSVFRFTPTYDIDIAWSFKAKGFKRNGGALAKLFLTGRWRSLVHRIGVIQGRQPDPFDAYDWMDELHHQTGLHPFYFFLVAEEKGRHDKNIDVTQPDFIALVKDTAAKYNVGLHPSWASGEQPQLLDKEKAWLEKTTGRPVTASRQHYIRFALPVTYRRLLAAGLTDDYSMGYATVNGFRASVAGSFWWYDVKEEKQTSLHIHPYCFMDANAFFEEKKSPQEALHELITYVQNIRAIGGEMITVWHNPFLGTDPFFNGWKETYAQFIKMVA